MQAELKRQGHPWALSKSFRASSPFGSMFSLRGINLEDLDLNLEVNGKSRQASSTSLMIFKVGGTQRIDVRGADYLKTCIPSVLRSPNPSQVGPVALSANTGLCLSRTRHWPSLPSAFPSPSPWHVFALHYSQYYRGHCVWCGNRVLSFLPPLNCPGGHCFTFLSTIVLNPLRIDAYGWLLPHCCPYRFSPIPDPLVLLPAQPPSPHLTQLQFTTLFPLLYTHPQQSPPCTAESAAPTSSICRCCL